MFYRPFPILLQVQAKSFPTIKLKMPTHGHLNICVAKLPQHLILLSFIN